MLVNKAAIQAEFNKGDSGYGDIALVWSDKIKSKGIAFLGDSITNTKITGLPVLDLYGVTSNSVEFWLAQYKLYDYGKTSRMNWELGFVEDSVKLHKFDVDYASLQHSVGGNFNLIEVAHQGAIIFPNNIKCVVVKKKEWVLPTVTHFRNVLKSQCPVITVDDYDD